MYGMELLQPRHGHDVCTLSVESNHYIKVEYKQQTPVFDCVFSHLKGYIICNTSLALVCTHMNTCIFPAESAETKADSLDAYMKSVGDHLDTTKKLEIKHSLHDLKKV